MASAHSFGANLLITRRAILTFFISLTEQIFFTKDCVFLRLLLRLTILTIRKWNGNWEWVLKRQRKEAKKKANRMEKHQKEERKEKELVKIINEEELAITLKSSTPLLRLLLF